MATIFLRSTDGDNGNAGTQKEAAKATLAAATAAAGAGGLVVVSSIHAETQASAMTFTSPGTPDNPVRVLCVADWGADTGTTVPTTLATTATVSTTGNNSITHSGSDYIYGVSFIAGNSTGTASVNIGGTGADVHLDSCALKCGSTGSASKIVFGTSTAPDQHFHLKNTTLEFSAATQKIETRGWVRWSQTPNAILGTVPTNLWSSGFGLLELYGVDLSALGSSNTLFPGSIAAPLVASLINCKLGASVAIAGTPNSSGGIRVSVVNCDSADTNYRYFLSTYQGETTHETTIVRTGGAADGTTPFSRKMVSNANTQVYSPLDGPWFKFWNETVGSPVTVAIQVVTDNVTLTDAEAWVECQYQGTSGYPLSVFTDDRVSDVLATPTNQTTSSETWTTTGLTTPVKQVLSVSVTPAEIGWIYARVCLAKASTTLYACPKILASSAVQYMESDGSIVNLPAGGSGGGVRMVNVNGGADQ